MSVTTYEFDGSERRRPGGASCRTGDGLRVAIRDRVPGFRDTLAGYLGSRGHTVVCAVGAHPDVLTTVRRVRPDVLVQDAGLVGMRALREVRHSTGPTARIRTVLLTSGQEGAARSALALGLADAIVPRTGGPVSIEEAVSRLASRDRRVSGREPDSLAVLDFETLTPREHEVVELLVAGYSTEQMAAELGIRASTVHTHVQSVLRKVGARSRLQAVSAYLAAGAPGRPVAQELRDRAAG